MHANPKSLILGALLLIGWTARGSAAVEVVWTENFDYYTGRFGGSRGNGDWRYDWDTGSKALRANFFREPTIDLRFADLFETYNAYACRIGFQAVVTPDSADGDSVSAVGRIGFLSSELFSTNNVLTVSLDQSSGGSFFKIYGRYGTGTEISSSSAVPFSFGNTYFLDAFLDGVARTFNVDIYSGSSSTGPLLGSLSCVLDDSQALQFDILGLTNLSDSAGARTLQAHFDDISFVIPEPSTVLLLLAGIISLRRHPR